MGWRLTPSGGVSQTLHCFGGACTTLRRPVLPQLAESASWADWPRYLPFQIFELHALRYHQSRAAKW